MEEEPSPPLSVALAQHAFDGERALAVKPTSAAQVAERAALQHFNSKGRSLRSIGAFEGSIYPSETIIVSWWASFSVR